MLFPIFTMPCLHSHHQPPPVLHSRDSHDGQISSSAAIGLTIGLALISVVLAAIIYFWCWRQHHRQRRHRRGNSESRHRRENPREHADNISDGNDARAAEMEQAPQGQYIGAYNEEGPPLPTVPLTIHHHQHEDKHFHGGYHHNHQHRDDQNLDCHDGNDDRGSHGNFHQDDHDPHHRHRHRHRRFHRAQQLLLPQDPIAELERLIRPLSPGIPTAARADLEAILNGLDIPLPDEPAQMNSRADTGDNEKGTGRRGEEQREKRRKRHHHHRHRHHCHHRHKRVVVH
ncbi:hypothetical protein V8C37DRAFT_411644 [Trichoderma ceciliae]